MSARLTTSYQTKANHFLAPRGIRDQVIMKIRVFLLASSLYILRPSVPVLQLHGRPSTRMFLAGRVESPVLDNLHLARIPLRILTPPSRGMRMCQSDRAGLASTGTSTSDSPPSLAIRTKINTRATTVWLKQISMGGSLQTAWTLILLSHWLSQLRLRRFRLDKEASRIYTKNN